MLRLWKWIHRGEIEEETLKLGDKTFGTDNIGRLANKEWLRDETIRRLRERKKEEGSN